METTITPSSGVSPKTVEKAVNSLLKWRAAKSKTQKPQLLEHDEFLYLILTLKKIPQKGTFIRTNPYKIPLPNPLINPENDNSEICLIIDDRPKSGLTKEAAKKKIENENIPISKIIKISKLKTDYRPFEEKRKLCDSFDMFFCDKRVVPLLPKMLGKQFFKKKKIPVGLDLKHKNWKEQFEKACGSGLLFLRSGTCSVVKVGRVSMGSEGLASNAMAAINGIADVVPRKWGGIRSFHLKLLDSLALPVYQALPDFKLRIEVGKDHEVEEEVEEKNVKEEKKKVGKKKKGRIHEIRYMDMDSNVDGDGDVLDDDDEEEEEEFLNGGEGDVDHDESEGKLGSDGLQGKKRKKGDVGKIGKKLKKNKVKKVDSVKRKKGVEGTKSGDRIKQKKSKKVTEAAA